MSARLRAAVREVQDRGYEVVVGRCMDGSRHVSASAADRAGELMSMLTDPTIRAVVPPWGGETAIDLIPLLDWDRLRDAEPTWFVGFSDISTLITPLTLLTGTATVHGNNLMDTPYRVPEGLLTWLDIVAAPPGHRFTQTPPGRHRSGGFDDFAAFPDVRCEPKRTPATASASSFSPIPVSARRRVSTETAIQQVAASYEHQAMDTGRPAERRTSRDVAEIMAPSWMPTASPESSNSWTKSRKLSAPPC